MHFEFNVYSTPLLFGFVQGWIYAILFCIRGQRQGRLSDVLFGGLLISSTFEIWEYMLGFGGIELLWNELDFFPRNFGLLLPPLAYFYIKSQLDSNFRFKTADLRHAAPFLVYALYHIAVFVQGPAAVDDWVERVHDPLGIEYVEIALRFATQLVYFYLAYRLLQQYGAWAPTQFSDTEAISFRWFRRFLIAYLAAGVAGWLMTVTDLWLKLDFWHDWWDELFNAGLIYYLSIEGYAQKQFRSIHFSPENEENAALELQKTEKISEQELTQWREKLERHMQEQQPYLDPELALGALAQRLGTNPSILSAAINGAFGKNFNDFVNGYRVDAVKKMLNDPSTAHYSLLGIGLECGFNSKSTFNRVFKKMTGLAPGDYAVQLKNGVVREL